MKIYVFNGSPRKNCNTAQMLHAFMEGLRSVLPQADLEYVNLYDYTYRGCLSCFACQKQESRSRLRCQIRDSLYEILDGAFHADGLVFGSPIYFFDITAQLRAFLERLMYPGDSDKVVPTAFVYTMNANEQQMKELNFQGALSTSQRFLASTFRQEPDLLYAFDTYQYNESPDLNPGFTAWNARKKQRHDEVFSQDLEKARTAGMAMAEKILAAKDGER